MKKEKWVDIKGYDYRYSISNKGEVFDKINKYIKKTSYTHGYEKTTLVSINNITKGYAVHRLVAINFIPNPQNKAHVHHKDENKSNNNVNNLQWVTPKEHANLRSEESKAKFRKTYRENKAKRETVHLVAPQSVVY